MCKLTGGVHFEGKRSREMGLIGNFARKRTASMVAHYDCEVCTAAMFQMICSGNVCLTLFVFIRQVAMMTYEFFFAFVDILSQHQAQRLANYVAESALTKYLSNLSLRRESEAEFAAMQHKRVPRRRRSSVMPVSIIDTCVNGGHSSAQTSPLVDEGNPFLIQELQSECMGTREGTNSLCITAQSAYTCELHH
jgi:hypothetical protein